MKALLQRVSQASVTVDGKVVGEIGRGLLVLFCAEQGDAADKLDYHVKKLLQLRIFEDEAGKMNRSVTDVGGELLVVSQFTLAADCRKGNRPSFVNALPPAEANALYEAYVHRLRTESGLKVETGVFGATMAVALVNDGPVTIWLEN